MTTEQLVEDAKKLKQPTKAAYQEYAGKQPELAGLLLRELFTMNGFDDAVRTENTDMLKDNIRNQFKFMESVYLSYEPSVFVNTIAWAFNVYLNHGFAAKFWDFLFPAVLKIYREQLSAETFLQLAPFYEWMQTHKGEFIGLAES